MTATPRPPGARTIDELLAAVRARIERVHLAEVAARSWVAGIGNDGYVLDDQSAIRVVDGAVDVISEGEWHFIQA